MESQDTVGLGTHGWVAFMCRHLSMQMFVLHVICSGDFGQEASYHFDDMLYRHSVDVVLRSLVPALLPEALSIVRKRFAVVVGQALYVGQVSDFYAARRSWC